MLKFYFNGAPNPTKVALFLEEAGLPYEPVPVDTRKGDQFKPGIPRDQSERQGAGDRRRRRRPCSTATPSCSTWPRRPASSCRPTGRRARGELLSWLMFVATGVGPYSGQAVHFRTFRAREAPLCHRTATPSRPSRHFGILDARLASDDTCWATPTPSSTWMCGAGRGMMPFVLGDERLGDAAALSSGWSTRSARVRRPQRAVALKDRSSSRPRWTRRRASHVPPPGVGRRLTGPSGRVAGHAPAAPQRLGRDCATKNPL